MFLSPEKALKKLAQQRQRGGPRKALRSALDTLERWPEDFDIALEALRLSLEAADFKTAVGLMKSTLRRHPRSRDQILGIAREALQQDFNPLLASFVVESLLRILDIDAVRETLRLGPRNYLTEMINRSQTRSSGLEGQGRQEGFIENELLLGLLMLEADRFDDAVEPLGRVLARSPENAELLGALILEIERERPQNASVQLYLGLASMFLEHPDKAEARFFRALELENAPARRIVDLLETGAGLSEHTLLLRGEALVEAGRSEEGIAFVRRYIDGPDSGGAAEILAADPVTAGDSAGLMATGFMPAGSTSAGGAVVIPAAGDRPARAQAALARLERLITRHAGLDLALLYAEIAAGIGRAKEAVEALVNHYERNPASAERLVASIENNAALAGAAPAQVFLTRLLAEGGAPERAAQASRRAAEIDPEAGRDLLKIIDTATAAQPDGHPALLAVKAELLARLGDGERACEIIKNLNSSGALEGRELARLSGAVLEHAETNLETIAAAIELGIRSGKIEELLPFALEFHHSAPAAGAELASRIAACAGSLPGGWSQAARLCDLIAEREQLERPLQLLQAQAHLHAGEIERAVFEFDRLIMFDENLRCDLIEMYEKVVDEHPRNTTLRLALFQLYFEEEHFTSASHHLARALESDPAQIRDVMPRFDRLVERDAGNRAVWEELLAAALRIGHIDLARETLSRAMRALPQKDAAALHIFGAKISRAENRGEDALHCLAQTLASPDANLREVEEELRGVVEAEPGSARARRLLGETLLRLGSEEQALAHFERCLELDPSSRAGVRETLEQHLPLSAMPWLISRLLGEIAWTEERFDQARRLFEAALKGPPESLEAFAGKMENMLRGHTDDEQLSLIAARCRALTGRSEEALALLDRPREGSAYDGRRAGICAEIIAREPLHPGANIMLARLLTRAGDMENALQALLRAAAAEAPAPDLVKALEEFLPVHGGDPRLLVSMASLRSGAGDFGGALADLRSALECAPGCHDEILAAIRATDWPGKNLGAALLLEADALIAGGFLRDAFGRLERIEADMRRQTETDMCPQTEAVLQRLRSIIDSEPAREHYLLAGRMLARVEDIEAAQAWLREGAGRLGGADAGDLVIALGEILHGAGVADRAAECFREVLSAGGDRSMILRRIETARGDWVRGEIERGLRRIDEGAASADEARRTAEIALEAGEIEAATRSLAACGDGGAERILRARVHLDAARPLLALAAVHGKSDLETAPERQLELLYIEGLVRERLGDFGRAAAVFSRIAGIDGDYRDCGSRALRAYTNYLSAPDGERAEMLVAISDLGPGSGKEQP